MSLTVSFSCEPMLQYARKESKLLEQDLWRVMEDMKCVIQHSNTTYVVTIPRGYLTDGASTPKAFWSLIPPWGAYGAGAILHDHLCEYLSLVYSGRIIRIPRKLADDIFIASLGTLEVPACDINLIDAALDTYRVLGQVTEPNWQKQKASLEAQWVNENPI